MVWYDHDGGEGIKDQRTTLVRPCECDGCDGGTIDGSINHGQSGGGAVDGPLFPAQVPRLKSWPIAGCGHVTARALRPLPNAHTGSFSFPPLYFTSPIAASALRMANLPRARRAKPERALSHRGARATRSLEKMCLILQAAATQHGQ